MDQEERLSVRELFASWAGEDVAAWEQAIGATVTHLSRGRGEVTNVSQEGGVVAIQVQYAKAVHQHALWEFRTELTSMTLPPDRTRGEFAQVVKARRLLRESDEKTNHAVARSARDWSARRGR